MSQEPRTEAVGTCGPGLLAAGEGEVHLPLGALAQVQVQGLSAKEEDPRNRSGSRQVRFVCGPKEGGLWEVGSKKGEEIGEIGEEMRDAG